MKITNRIEISAIPEKVFYWLEDPDRTKKWMTSIIKTDIIAETPKMIGATFREV